MRGRVENISRHLEQLPMLRVLLPIVVGVIIAERVTFPLWSVSLGFVLSVGVAAWLRSRSVANIYLFVAFSLLGVMAVELRRGQSVESLQELSERNYEVEVAIDRITNHRADKVLCDGRVVAYHMGREKSVMQRANFEVRVVADSSVGLQIGSRVVANSRLRLFAHNSENRYEAYMARRGVVGQLGLRQSDVMYYSLKGKSVVRWLHAKALQRLCRLSLTPQSRAVVEAMTIGERGSVDSSLREEYARSGSAHLLAVSGLHVGFVFAVINILLLAFALLRHGQLWRVVPAVAAIWIYAAVAGASPSVVRAAVMFSILQLAFVVSARTQALNSLAFTASVMILCSASLLHDVGFLLSFAAVAGIVVWGVPLSRWSVVTRRPFERKLTYKSWRRDAVQSVVVVMWQAVAMSLTASVATMPLTAYMFGVVSWWSVVLGPLMILIGMAVVSVAMAWILLPIGFMSGVASWLLETLTSTMNSIAAWCSQSGLLIQEGYISGWLCGGCYVAFVLFTLLIWSRDSANRLPKG